MAEHELDVKIRGVLMDLGLKAYEKVKEYNDMMQRYLSLLKQGEKEDQHMKIHTLLQAVVRPDSQLWS